MSFTAVNAVDRELANPTHLPFTHQGPAPPSPAASNPESLPEVQELLARQPTGIRAEEPEDICDRDWELQRIVRHEVRSGERWYKCVWENSVLLEKDIQHRPDGSKFVRCDGQPCDIVEDWDACIPDALTGRKRRWVRWKYYSWRPISWLQKARGLVEDYESWSRGLPTPVSSGSGPSQATGSEINNATQPEASEPRPEESDFIYSEESFKLIARPGVDYGPTIRHALQTRYYHSVKRQRRDLLDLVPVRPTTFRESFFRRGATINFDHIRQNSGNALLAYIAGYKQPQPCRSCVEGHGPYAGCVVLPMFGKSACVNCTHSRMGGVQCNFHLESERRREPHLSHNGEAATTALPSSSPAMYSPGALSMRSSICVGSPSSPTTTATSPSTVMSAYRQYARRELSPERGIIPFSVFGQHSIGDDSSASARNGTMRTALQELSPAERNRRHQPLMSSTRTAETAKRLRSVSPATPSNDPLASSPSRQTPSKRKRQDSSASSIQFLGCRRRRAKSAEPPSPPADSNDEMEEPEDWLCESHQCQRTDDRCDDPVAGYNECFRARNPMAVFTPVTKEQRFRTGEASDAQIRYILSLCPCGKAAGFEDRWQWKLELDEKAGRRSRWTKEALISKKFPREVNWVINAYCPEAE